MSDLRFTGRTKDLLDAARRDGPSAAQKSRIWNGVALAPQLSLVVSTARDSLRPETMAASAAHAKAAASVAAALSAGKLLVLGAIAGSALTLGLGAVVLRGAIRHAPVATASESGTIADGPTYEAYAPHIPAAVPALDGPALDGPVLDRRVLDRRALAAAEPTKRPASEHASAVTGSHGSRRADGEAALTREVSLVGEARASLAQGDGAAALRSLDLASHGSSHSLEPEELALRSRALRAMGREDEARRVDEALKARFPGSFLAQ